MAVRKIIRMGHPALRRPARPVDEADIGSDAMHRLVADMIDTLHDYGGIGLAAPQINEGIRLAIVEIPGGPTRYGELEGRELTICVNPEIEVVKSDIAGYWEGCLSVPGLRGFVERPQHIQVHYTNLKRERETISADGFLATVFQHEFDHLDGKLYVDHIKDPRKLVFEEEYVRYVLPAEEPSAGEREGPAPRMQEPSAGERGGAAPRMQEPSAGERGGPAPRMQEPSAGERGGPAPRMQEPSAGERGGPAPRMEEPSAGEREGPAPRMQEPLADKPA